MAIVRRMSFPLNELPSYGRTKENFLKQKWKELMGFDLKPASKSLSTSALRPIERSDLRSLHQFEVRKQDVSKLDAEIPVPLAFISFEDKAKKDTPEQKTPLLIHHNLIGSKENWKTACMEIFHVTKRSVFAVDARNHGESPHTNVMSYSTMAKDVECFAKKMNSSKVCYIGHSFGGRLGLLLAMLKPDIFEKIVVVDSSPFMDKNSFEKWELLREASFVLQEIEDQLRSVSGVARKSMADKAIEHILPDKKDRALFLSNLLTTENDQKLWKINLEAILSNPDLMTDYTDLFFAGDSQYQGPVLFISGEKSQNIRKADEDAIRTFFPKTEFVWLPKTGQYLHIEKHTEVMKKIVTYIESH